MSNAAPLLPRVEPWRAAVSVRTPPPKSDRVARKEE